MDLNVQQSERVAADDFEVEHVKLPDEAGTSGEVVPAAGAERSVTLVVPDERPGGGIRGRFPEFAGFWDDPTETVIELADSDTACPR